MTMTIGAFTTLLVVYVVSNTKYYTELLRELREIAKEVPLSDTVQSAITFVFGGEWGEAIEALDKLKSKSNEQN